jgi:glycosyltransferase involved in cell wall biosynthesis
MHRLILLDQDTKMGGVEWSTLYLASALDRRRFEPLVVCPGEGDLPARCRERGLPVALVPRPRFRSLGITIGRRALTNPAAALLNGAACLRAALPVAALLRRTGAGLLCTKGLLAHVYGGLAARLAGVPCVWHLQDVVHPRRGYGLYPLLLSGLGLALATRIIADARSVVDQLAPALHGRSRVVYNGVDIAQFHPGIDGSGVRREFGIAPQAPLVGAVGRLTRWKGQHVLIEAFAAVANALPEARLLIVGAPVFEDGSYAGELHALARRLGLQHRVIFAGWRWDLPQVLAALDLYVHPSLEKDSAPVALVSALAAGRASIASAVPGIAEILHAPADSLLVPPGDAPALRDALLLLLRSPRARRALAGQARATALRELSLERFARGCEAVFEEAL